MGPEETIPSFLQSEKKTFFLGDKSVELFYDDGLGNLKENHKHSKVLS